MTENSLLTIQELAAEFKVTPKLVRTWIRLGMPHFHPSPRIIRISLAEALDWCRNSLPALKRRTRTKRVVTKSAEVTL